jgi:hypothetical protein
MLFRLDLGAAGGEEHAAGFAASARVDLRFDDGALEAQFVEGPRGLFRRRRDAAGGHGKSPRGEQRLGLVFVDVHSRVPRACKTVRLAAGRALTQYIIPATCWSEGRRHGGVSERG